MIIHKKKVCKCNFLNIFFLNREIIGFFDSCFGMLCCSCKIHLLFGLLLSRLGQCLPHVWLLLFLHSKLKLFNHPSSLHPGCKSERTALPQQRHSRMLHASADVRILTPQALHSHTSWQNMLAAAGNAWQCQIFAFFKTRIGCF